MKKTIAFLCCILCILFAEEAFGATEYAVFMDFPTKQWYLRETNEAGETVDTALEQKNAKSYLKIFELTEKIEKDPKNIELYAARAKEYHRNRLSDPAIADLEHVLQDPRMSFVDSKQEYEINYLLYELYVGKGDNDLAKPLGKVLVENTYFKQLSDSGTGADLSDSFQYATVCYNYAVNCMHATPPDYQEARRILDYGMAQQYFRSFPQEVWPVVLMYRQFDAAYRKLEQQTLLDISDYLQQIQMGNSDIDTLYHLSYRYMSDNNYVNSIHYLQQAVELCEGKPLQTYSDQELYQFGKCYLFLGEIFYISDDLVQARPALEKAMELFSLRAAGLHPLDEWDCATCLTGIYINTQEYDLMYQLLTYIYEQKSYQSVARSIRLGYEIDEPIAYKAAYDRYRWMCTLYEEINKTAKEKDENHE